MSNVTYLKPGQQDPLQVELVQQTSVHSLMIPLHGEELLLPNASVAEVIGYISPEPIGDAPEWLLGMIQWRECRVPLISYEIASANEKGRGQASSRIAILNTLNGNARIPYIAIATQGIPHLVVARDQNISVISEVAAHRLSVLEIVEVDDQQAVIPDIDDLEDRLQKIKLG